MIIIQTYQIFQMYINIQIVSSSYIDLRKNVHDKFLAHIPI